MQKRIMLMSAVVVTLLSSCVKDSISEPDFNTDSNGVTFTASMELATKTTLDTETGEVAWAVGDVVKFDYEIGKADCEPVVSQPLTAEDIVDGIARFTADVPEEFLMTEKEYKESLEEGAENSRHMYVVYPSVETEYEASTYYVTIPVEQDGSFESASIALAKWNPKTPTAELNFMNLCALLQFTVPEDMAAVRQIVFTAANRKIAGKASVGFGSVVPYTPYVKGMTDESSTTVIVNVDGPGTYYAAVSTGELKDICLAYRDEDGKPVGELVSGVSFNAERAMIYRVGATVEADNFPGEGGYFVKPVACGAQDGSSWDNAADYATFRELFGTKTDNKVVYFAGGEYDVDAVANVSAAHVNLSIYGGYPATATGYSLSGRDLESNPTVLKYAEETKGNRIWNFAAGTYYVDGITMTGCEVNNVGAAFSIKKTAVVHCNNCIFTNNTSKKFGGAVGFENLTSTGTRFVNCQFVSNAATSSALGGAVSANNTATVTTPGTVSFENCLFDKNTSEAGVGAVCSEFVNYRFVDCTFRDNTDKNNIADAIYMKGSNGVTVYCDACNFYYTASDYFGTNGNAGSGSIIKNNAENGVMAMNNCLLTGPWGLKTGQIITGKDNANTVIVNSTLFSQTSYPAVLVNKGLTHVLNSIVINAADGGKGRGVATNGKSVVSNSILTKVDESGEEVTVSTDKTTYNNNLIVVSHQKETFPVEPTWYKSGDGYADMWNNKNATTDIVDDCRGKLYYYAWDGAYPEGAEFTNATLTEVTDLVKAADANFAEWLGDRLGKDIRGVQRDAASMWPGSYQN